MLSSNFPILLPSRPLLEEFFRGNTRSPRRHAFRAGRPLASGPGIRVGNAIHVGVVLDECAARIGEVIKNVGADDMPAGSPNRTPSAFLQKLLPCHDLVKVFQPERNVVKSLSLVPNQ